MKALLLTIGATLSLVLVVACGAKAKPSVDVSAWADSYEALLQRYVTPAGVRYTAWKASAADMAALQVVATHIAQTAVPADPTARLAFYIDAYNATVLSQVLAVFPIPGVLEHDPDFFKQSAVIAGETMSLDHLENEIIRKQFKEPRIHFALNCASVSCPPLLAKPYSSCDLDAELERQTLAYLKSSQGCEEVGGKVLVSQLFEWFAGDFEAAEGSAAKFIAKHRQQPLPSDALTFRPYDWNLNLAP
jgi:hypothetical protein